MLSLVEHETGFITSVPGLSTRGNDLHNFNFVKILDILTNNNKS